MKNALARVRTFFRLWRHSRSNRALAAARRARFKPRLYTADDNTFALVVSKGCLFYGTGRVSTDAETGDASVEVLAQWE